MSDISFISSTEPSYFPTLHLPPVPTLAELLMEIIQLENEFYTLYQLLPDYPTDQQLADFYKLRETKESYLKQKCAHMQEVRVALESPSPPLSLSPTFFPVVPLTAVEDPLTHIVHYVLIIPISHAHAHHSPPSHNEQSHKPPLANITTRRTHFKDLQHDLSNMRQLITLPTFCNLNGSNDHQYIHPSGIFFLCNGTGRGCIEVDPGNAEQAVRAQRRFYYNLDEYRAFHNCPPLTLCPHHSPTNLPLYYPPTYNPVSYTHLTLPTKRIV